MSHHLSTAQTRTQLPSPSPSRSPHPKSRLPPPSRSLTPPPSTSTLPRILCLHGGGVNSLIFRSQLRSFLSHPSLITRYRFVFIDAPFPCAEGVGVVPVYADWGPFLRWSRWLKSHDEISVEEARNTVWDAVLEGMNKDDIDGGTGEWVAVLGFSQGAKVACSLLYEQQLARLKGGEPKTDFKMGIIFAGRAPFLALSEESEGYPWMQSANGLADAADTESIDERPDLRLQVPTIHVHGLKDEGLGLHRRAVEGYCAPGTSEVVEWDGPHRLPIKSADVENVVKCWLGVADEYGL